MYLTVKVLHTVEIPVPPNQEEMVKTMLKTGVPIESIEEYVYGLSQEKIQYENRQVLRPEVLGGHSTIVIKDGNGTVIGKNSDKILDDKKWVIVPGLTNGLS
jgi:hypothetical protein